VGDDHVSPVVQHASTRGGTVEITVAQMVSPAPATSD
jgi:hypothetical protein